MKKLALTVLSMGLALSLAACGNSGKNLTVSGLDDLKGLRISAQNGTQGEEIAQTYSDKVTGFAKYADAILALKQSKVEATFMDGLPAERIVSQNPDLAIFKQPLATESYAIALAKDNQALLETVNAVIEEWLQSGEMNRQVSAYQADEEAAAKTLDYNAQGTQGELVLGTEAGFAPYETKLGDQIVGSDIALAQAIAKKLDKKLKVVDMDFDALIAAVQSGKVDLVAAGMTITEERAKQVSFSKPYFEAQQVAVLRKANLASAPEATK